MIVEMKKDNQEDVLLDGRGNWLKDDEMERSPHPKHIFQLLFFWNLKNCLGSLE